MAFYAFVYHSFSFLPAIFLAPFSFFIFLLPFYSFHFLFTLFYSYLFHFFFFSPFHPPKSWKKGSWCGVLLLAV